jgi:hypothetical protein
MIYNIYFDNRADAKSVLSPVMNQFCLSNHMMARLGEKWITVHSISF